MGEPLFLFGFSRQALLANLAACGSWVLPLTHGALGGQG